MLVLGCVRTESAPPRTPVIETRPVIITPHDDEPAEATFERALVLLRGGDPRGAAALFDRLAAEHTTDAMAPLASFNAAVAWEQAGDRDAALSRFRSAAERFPEGEIGKWALLRTARLYGYLEQWSQLSALSDLLSSRLDLTATEKLEALGAKALAVVEAGDPDAAEKLIAKGRNIVDDLRLGEGGKLPLEVAQIDFALGEVRRLRGEAIVFVPTILESPTPSGVPQGLRPGMPANFADALERRCQLLLDAQSAYSDAMRSYDAHWATMSGFRIGELYQNLHRDVMAMPVPTAAHTTADKRLFEGAMRLRYRVLLEKGLKMMEHTVLTAERTGESGPWIERARAAKREIEVALDEQKARIAALPYTEKELQKALDDLAAKYRP